jgi:hypothetical protein
MLILNGKKFAESESEFIESLFDSGGTCAGYAKRNKRSVTLKNMQGEKIGVINSHGVLCAARKLDNGRWWYSYADIPEIGRYDSYMQQVNECEKALKGE